MGFLSSIMNPAGSAAKYNVAAQAQIGKARDEAVGYLDPYMEGGEKGFRTIADLYGLNGEDAQRMASGSFATSPGYQFRYDQGVKAIDNAASAQGMRRSGATLKALTQFGQDTASGEYNNWLKGLQGLGTAGLASAGKGADVQMNAGNSIASLISKTGEAKANQGIAQGNLLGNLVGKAFNIFAAGGM